MREHQEAKTDRVKRNRRQWLVALILAGSPCLAEEPQRGGLGILPPLPLSATKAAPTVSSNPYCAPQNVAHPPNIQLTTGASQASHASHLSPIGAAIGLNPIATEQSNVRPAERSPVMTIEPAHESVIQFNPLLQSVHHQNNDLVETILTPTQPVSHSTPQVAAAVTKPASKPMPTSTTGEASILLFTPAPKPLLVVKPQPAIIPAPQISGQPATSVQSASSGTPRTTATTLKKATSVDVPLPTVASEKKTALPLTKTKSKVPSPVNHPATGDKLSAKPASATKPTQKTASNKDVRGTSIASMLSQTPQTPAGVSEKETAAPIFFSLSDNTEVAPSEKVLPRRTTIALPSSDTIQDLNAVPSVPLTVTVKEDGSVVTAVRQKPIKSKVEKKTTPQPILAGENTLGTGLDLPRPKALPKAAPEPKRMPDSTKTAKRITPSGKSILSKTGPNSSDKHEQLSVAKVKEFKPRTGSSDTTAITPAKPFSILGEKAKPMPETRATAKAVSIIAKAPSTAKSAKTTEPDNAKLTLPTPITIPDNVASSESTDESGHSIIKVARPSTKDSAKSNPHAEATSTETKPDLVNPFNRQQDARTAVSNESQLPESTEMKQAVRVEKFKISKDRLNVRVNLDSALGSKTKTQKSPIASGVVAPIVLPDSVEPKQASAKPASAKPASAKSASEKPATETSKARPSSAPPKTTSNAIVASPASGRVKATTSTLNKITGSDEQPAETTILRKKYRPLVAVQAISGTITRQNIIASNDSAKIQAAPEMVIDDNKTLSPAVDLQRAMRLDTTSELKDPSLVLGPDVKLTQLHMNQAQVRSLTLGGSVRGVRVGDKGVCQAFASGPNQLKLIGTGIGTTQLVVWAQNNDGTDEVLMRAFEIHVDEFVPEQVFWFDTDH